MILLLWHRLSFLGTCLKGTNQCILGTLQDLQFSSEEMLWPTQSSRYQSSKLLRSINFASLQPTSKHIPPFHSNKMLFPPPVSVVCRCYSWLMYIIEQFKKFTYSYWCWKSKKMYDSSSCSHLIASKIAASEQETWVVRVIFWLCSFPPCFFLFLNRPLCVKKYGWSLRSFPLQKLGSNTYDFTPKTSPVTPSVMRYVYVQLAYR